MVDYIEKIQFQGQTLPIGGFQFNGPWVRKVAILVNNVGINKDAIITVNLDTYLPNDNYDYEVYFMLVATTGAVSGNSLEIQAHAGSNISSSPVIRALYAITRQAANEHSTKSAYLPVKHTDRAITFQNKGNANATNFSVYLKGYRRMGLNQINNQTISNIKYQNQDLVVGGQNFDCGWTNTSVQLIASGTSVANGAHIDCSLSGILPADGHDYMVLLCGWGDTGAASGNSIRMKVVNGSYSNVDTTASDFYMFGGVTRTASNRAYGGCVLVPIRANDRVVSLTNTGNATGNIALHLRGYKKLGLNPSNYIEQIALGSNNFHFAGTQFDGPWVNHNATIANYSSLVYNQTYEVDLSNILPDDDFDYEVLLDGYIWTTTTVGQGAECYIRTGYTGNVMFVRCRTRASSQCDMGSIIMPVPKNNRTIYLLNSIGQNSGSFMLYIRGYRRLGSNRL